MKRVLSIAALLLSCFASLFAETPASPELKVLDRLAGWWRFEATTHEAEWTPEEKHATGTNLCTWSLGGRFLEEKGTDTEKNSHLRLYTYDTLQKDYHTWWFSSTGHVNDSAGQWDAEAKIFKWVSTLPSGQTVTSKHHFVKDNTVAWSVVVTDAAGKIYFHMEGKMFRLKESKQ